MSNEDPYENINNAVERSDSDAVESIINAKERELKESNEDVKESIGRYLNAPDEIGRIPLICAAALDEISAYRRLREDDPHSADLLEHGGVSEECKQKCDNALIKATERKLCIVKLLVDKGAEVNAQNRTNDTPLGLAVRTSKCDTIEFLSRSDNESLRKEMERIYLEVIKFLLDHGAKVEVEKAGSSEFSSGKPQLVSVSGLDLLIWAVINNLEAAELLIERARDGTCDKLSNWAAQNGYEHIVDPLIEKRRREGN